MQQKDSVPSERRIYLPTPGLLTSTYNSYEYSVSMHPGSLNQSSWIQNEKKIIIN